MPEQRPPNAAAAASSSEESSSDDGDAGYEDADGVIVVAATNRAGIEDRQALAGAHGLGGFGTRRLAPRVFVWPAREPLPAKVRSW